MGMKAEKLRIPTSSPFGGVGWDAEFCFPNLFDWGLGMGGGSALWREAAGTNR